MRFGRLAFNQPVLKQESKSSQNPTAARSKIISQCGTKLHHIGLVSVNPHPAVASTDSVSLCILMQ